MAIKAAKESFDKEDIIEILKRNVSLFKDEKEFVDYIVNLAMYLMDQYYGQQLGPEDFEPTMVAGSSPLPVDLSGDEIKPPKPIRPEPQYDSGIEPSVMPPTAEERFRRQAGPRTVQAFVTSPQDAPDDSDFKMPPTPGDVAKRKSPPAPRDVEDQKPLMEVQSSPLTTPIRGPLSDKNEHPATERALPPEDRTKIDISSQGRTRVYRVVRSYKSATNLEMPCPICGTQVPLGEKQCSGCGHIM